MDNKSVKKFREILSTILVSIILCGFASVLFLSIFVITMGALVAMGVVQ